jgi:large subunit ribosomal protein L29
MKISELNDKTLAELAALGREKRQEIFNLRLQQAGSRLEKPSQLRSLRRDIARIETRMSQMRNKAA